MNAKELLEEAWELIKDPAKRCTVQYATDANGRMADVCTPNAVKFCSVGALIKAANLNGVSAFQEDYSIARGLLNKASRELFREDVTIASDKDILNNPPLIYARAIELASIKE